MIVAYDNSPGHRSFYVEAEKNSNNTYLTHGRYSLAKLNTNIKEDACTRKDRFKLVLICRCTLRVTIFVIGFFKKKVMSYIYEITGLNV